MSCRSGANVSLALLANLGLPILDEQHAVCPPQQRRPVRDHDPHDARPLDQVGNGVLGGLVEVCRSLVEEEQARITASTCRRRSSPGPTR
jgi:hypothetical protein